MEAPSSQSTNLVPFHSQESNLLQVDAKPNRYSKIPNDKILKRYAITRQEFEEIIEYVEDMAPFNENKVIKKMFSGLAFTIGLTPTVNEIAIFIFFKKSRLCAMGRSANCSITLAWDVNAQREVVIRSAKSESICNTERKINRLLSKYKDLFVAGDIFFDYLGSCEKKDPVYFVHGQNEEGEFIPKLQSFLKQNESFIEKPFLDKSAIVLERLDGCFQAVNSNLSSKELFTIIHDVLKGLVVLHEELKLVHIDIKPDNILVNRNKNHTKAKIGDFGFTTFKGESIKRLCSSPYPSPEIIKLNHLKQIETYKADFPTDIWSFGVSVAAMISFASRSSMWDYWNGLYNSLGSEDLLDNNSSEYLFEQNGFENTFKLFVSKYLDNFKNDISKRRNPEYLKLLPMIEQCLQVDPAERITARQGLEIMESLIETA